jgi:hypothetical protein
MNKYEQLIEHIINDEEGKARALFHEIVVEKSRDIYESLMDEEYAEESMGGSAVNRMVDEIASDETGGVQEDEDDEEGDMDDMSPMGSMDDEEGDMGDEGDLEQKVMDLESELDALKAEFEALMGDEEGEEEHDDMDAMDMDAMDMGDEEGEEEFDMMEDEEMSESFYESTRRAPLQKTAVDLMREYVETIGKNNGPLVGTTTGGDHANVNDSSVVAGKNDMGGTAQNIAKGGSNTAPDGTSAPKKGTVKDVKDAGNWENKPGANAGKAFSGKAKAKSGEGQTTDGSVPVNKTSIERGGN